jgi:serine/threonine protein kinase
MAPDPQDTRVDRGAAPSAGAEAPRRIGRFETVRLLGRGGMGSVYLAEDRVIGRQVAIKEIRVEEGVSEAARAEQRVRFEVELRATGRLSHPNIATVYDAFETGGSYCIALEYVPGISLDERLKTPPPLGITEVADLAGQIASGLDYAHRRGIVHRDVKPGNVLLSEEGVVKITDFGIAKLVSLDVTQTGIALGTPAYMSPEQIQGKPLDGRSDQFSLGVLLYQMLTGRLPFDAPNAHSMLYQILHAEPERSTLSPAVERVLSRALAKEPADRYPTCTALAQELRDALSGAGTPPPAPFESSPLPARRILPWVLGILGALGILIVAAFLLLVFTEDWESGPSRPIPQTSPAPGITPSSPSATPQPPQPIIQETATPEPSAVSPGPVAVEITSEPGRCHLTIDGRHAGFTPRTESLDPGPHQFTCEWPGQGKRSFVETVSPERRRLNFKL